MTSPPSLSIVTPVWNGLPYIRECIESVLAQDYTDWEMIISDNGSTDGTRDYLETLTDPRITVFKQETNLGIFGNMNFLVDQARAPIVKILCADDYLLPGGLDILQESWKEAPADATFIRNNWRRDTKTYLSSRILKDWQKRKNTSLIFFVFGNPAGNLTNISFKRHYFAMGTRFRTDLPYAGDYEYWGRLGQLGSWKLDVKEVAYVRTHSGQASVYLNLKGELIGEQSEVICGFFKDAITKSDPFVLRLRGSWKYFRFIRQALRNPNMHNIRAMLRHLKSPAHAHPLVTWLLFLFTFGGSFGEDVLSLKALGDSIK